MWFGSRYSFSPPSLFLWNAEGNSTCCKPQLFSWMQRQERENIFVHTPPFLFKAHPVYFSLTMDCCIISVWITAPSEQLCMDFLWVDEFMKAFPNNEKHFLRHFIMVNLKRPFCFLQLNVDLLACLNGSLEAGALNSLGTFAIWCTISKCKLSIKRTKGKGRLIFVMLV